MKHFFYHLGNAALCDFKCNVLLSTVFCYWHFCKYFLQNKIKIGEHKSWGSKHMSMADTFFIQVSKRSCHKCLQTLNFSVYKAVWNGSK